MDRYEEKIAGTIAAGLWLFGFGAWVEVLSKDLTEGFLFGYFIAWASITLMGIIWGTYIGTQYLFIRKWPMLEKKFGPVFIGIFICTVLLIRIY